MSCIMFAEMVPIVFEPSGLGWWARGAPPIVDRVPIAMGNLVHFGQVGGKPGIVFAHRQCRDGRQRWFFNELVGSLCEDFPLLMLGTVCKHAFMTAGVLRMAQKGFSQCRVVLGSCDCVTFNWLPQNGEQLLSSVRELFSVCGRLPFIVVRLISKRDQQLV